MISYLVPPSRVRRLQRDPADRARASSAWTGPVLGARVRLADLLWKRTVVSQEWLAAKLEMKSAANHPHLRSALISSSSLFTTICN